MEFCRIIFFVCTSCYVMIENKENDFLIYDFIIMPTFYSVKKNFHFFFDFSLIQRLSSMIFYKIKAFLLFKLKNQAFYCAEGAEWTCFSASV